MAAPPPRRSEPSPPRRPGRDRADIGWAERVKFGTDSARRFVMNSYILRGIGHASGSDSYPLFALPIERRPAHLVNLGGTGSKKGPTHTHVRPGGEPEHIGPLRPEVPGATASELAFHPDPNGR
ncbi:hypothetical protein SGPA1_41038 [Streptomyces misionensis JCM 4497]